MSLDRLLNPITPAGAGVSQASSSQGYQLDNTQAPQSSGNSIVVIDDDNAMEDLHENEEADEGDMDEEHYIDAEEVQWVEVDDDEDDEAEEGEGEGEGEGEAEEEEDEEEEEEEESDDDDDKSEDLDGDREEEDFEITAATVTATAGASGDVLVKSEPGEPLAVSTDAQGTDAAPAVALVKKKKRPRAASIDDMPKPRMPIPTIRLEFSLDTKTDYAMINIMDLAKQAGLIPDDAIEEPPEEDREEGDDAKMDVDAPVAGPSTPGPAGLFGIGGHDESAEEIARRFEEKYDNVPAKKVSH